MTTLPKHPQPTNVSRLVQHARWRRGLTCAQLGSLSGLSYLYISNIELGYRRAPNAVTLLKLGRALGLRDEQVRDAFWADVVALVEGE